ncbi:hypothetical protein YYG_03444 [Plasmodium vinckei petteri]|uniref:protein acetyllysine N-acetyltransferase n=1 Tax=Plasmodium vinckei petteri TaxID=138298 RepID=W7ADL6_PLAVN|nr:hypothetical protein YYG_03444 [Plasmodium vinckei petteri]CAD2111444.1 histone deacetylase, putative [Plasmodium vinckei petteri]
MSCMYYASRLSKNENKGPLGEKEYFEDEEEEKEKIKVLIEKIRTSEYIVVHSGAGISTSSGLQDFRGPTGIWTNEYHNNMKNKKKHNKKKKTKKEEEQETVQNCEDNENIDKQNQLMENEQILKHPQIKYDNPNDPSNQFSINKKEPHFHRIKEEINESNIDNIYESSNNNLLETQRDIEKKENENNENCQSSDENYVKFGNRKKKVVELHLALPTKTHIMIKELMNKNIIKFLITQNIDSLHYRCGTKFSQISEIHGNIFIERCDFCGRRYLRDYVISTISFKPTGSLCFLCSFPPIGICTDVLLDWNNAYEDFFHLNSIKHSQKADFHFCLGSSFYIVPASYYPSKKKFANKDSYSCLINYQKSSLFKELDLNIHSNVNNISDIIIKEFSLEPLAIRSALLIVVRCQLINFDVLYDQMVKLNNIDKNVHDGIETENENTDYSRHSFQTYTIKKGEIDRNEHTSICKNEMSNQNNYTNCSNNANNNNCNMDSNKFVSDNVISINDDINRSNGASPFLGNGERINEPEIENTNKDQLFLIKCSMIKNIKTEKLNNLHKITINEIDKGKGIWLIRTNSSCLLEIELWFNSYILLKLIYNDKTPFIELNTWAIDVAYTYGDDIDDSYFSNNKGNFKQFSLNKNKYTANHEEGIEIDDSNVTSDMINKENDGVKISEILNEHVHVGFNPRNVKPKNKVQLLAILSNTFDMNKYNNYHSFELSNSVNLLYNLFCMVNKFNEENNFYIKKKLNDNEKTIQFIKNLHLSKNIYLYTNDFLNLFNNNDKTISHSTYTFRERKKRNLEDFNVYSSDEHKENTSNFIFYDLYMNEDISLYKIQLNKTLINKEIINNSHHNKNISNYDRSLLKRENFQQISSKEKDNNINNTILSEGQHFDINKEAPIDICTNEAKETISNNENLNISNKTSLKNELPFTNYMNNGNRTSPNKITNSQSNNDDIMLDSNASNKQASNVNIIIPNCEESDIKNNHNKKSNEVQIENASNTENNINDKNGGEHYSQLLFYPRLLINNKYKHGELVHKIPKYIKPQKIYTPYKKLSRNKKYSNTLQKYRSEIWENNYHEFVNNIDKEHIVDSTLYKELRYFPFWLLNYANDLFECV